MRRKSLVEFANNTNTTLSENDLNAFELSLQHSDKNGADSATIS